MLPGNVDPRRPDKVQRYVPKSNGNGQEDLTTDYMNILGQHATTSTANVPEPNTDKHHADSSVVGGGGGVSGTEAGLQVHPTLEEDELAASVVVVPPPTSPPQYGVAILPNNHPATTTMAESDETPSPGLDINQVVKTGGEDGVNVISSSNASNNTSNSKDLQSTPSRNDRFKVVKIASLEPFKRGRWKCMDYVDEAPPNSNVQGNKVAQSSGSIQVATATAGGGGPTGVYLQTQSLPQQQIQQMLLQSGFSNGTPVFPTTAQMLPQGQYYYPAPQQVLQQAQFIGSQPQPAYFPAGVTIQNAAGFAQFVPQYVPNLHVPTQNSAFVATSQPVQMPGNFQQSQTYGGQTNVGQGQQQQPLVNGHSYGQNEQQQQVGGGGGGSIPTQAVKSVILNSAGPQPVVSQNQITQQLAAVTQQQQQQPNHMPPQSAVQQQQQQQQQQNNQSQSVTAIPNHHQQSQQQYVQANIVGFQSHPQPQQQQVTMTNAAPLSSNQTTTTTNQVQTVPVVQTPAIIQVSQVVPAQNFDQSLANNVYTNPQFTMSVNSLTVLDNSHEAPQGGDVMLQEAGGAETGGNDSAEDLTANTNPVVNAIDNKIEQAMDLVKSHLMYTVREEVEVLKEKITELMDRIQQLETENNFLRNQIPKNQQQQQVASSSSSSTVCTSNAVTTTNTVPMVVNAATVGTVAASAGPPPTVATNNPVGLGNNYNSSQSAANAVTPNDVISNQ